MRALRVGDPLDLSTQVGAVASADIRATTRPRSRPRPRPAPCLLGGAPLAGPGWFYPPTVLADVPRRPAYHEEVFAPVALVFRAAASTRRSRSPTTPASLGAAAWSRDGRSSGASSTSSPPGWCSSTAWSPPTRGCRSRDQALRLRPRARRPRLREFVNVQTVWIRE